MPPSQVRGARLKNRDELRCEGEVGLVPGHCVSFFFLILFLSVPSRLVWVLAHPVRVSLPPNVILINPRLFLVIHPFCVALPSPSPLSIPTFHSRPSSPPPSSMLALMFPTPAPYPFNVPTTSHKRPRGLWKRRRVDPHSQSRPWPNSEMFTHGPRIAQPDFDNLHLPYHRSSSSYTNPQYDNDNNNTSSPDLDFDDSASSSSSKRRRLSGPYDNFSDFSSHKASSSSGSHTPLSDLYHAKPPTPRLPESMSSSTSSKTSSASTSANLSISAKGKQPTTTADYEDWENLKELFARAVERYDCASVVNVYILHALVAYEIQIWLVFLCVVL